MSMDGTMRQTLHNTDLVWPNGITIDYLTQTLYWVDAKLDKIESSFVNGSNRRLVTTTFVFHPFSIVFFEDVLYWSDWLIKQVIYAPVSSIHEVVGLISPLPKLPMGLRVVGLGSQPISKCLLLLLLLLSWCYLLLSLFIFTYKKLCDNN